MSKNAARATTRRTRTLETGRIGSIDKDRRRRRRLLTALTITATLGLTSCATLDLGPPPRPETSGAGAPRSTAAASSGPLTLRATAAAATLLETLSAGQREVLLHEASDPVVREWSNLPATVAPRAGLRLGDLSKTQASAAFRVAEAVLSPEGYAEMTQIMAADDELNRRGGSSFSSRDYYIAFFGDPRSQDRFTVQIGGHHLAVNVTFAEGKVSPTPAFTGIDPVEFDLGGATVSPLSDEADHLFALISSLSPSEREQAMVGGSFNDVLVGPGEDGNFPSQPEGILVSNLTPRQQRAVLEAIMAWTGDAPEQVARPLARAYAAELPKTRIGWATSTDPSDAGTYVRIDGPRVWIEFSVQPQIGAGDKVHYHSVYRDKHLDYLVST